MVVAISYNALTQAEYQQAGLESAVREYMLAGGVLTPRVNECIDKCVLYGHPAAYVNNYVQNHAPFPEFSGAAAPFNAPNVNLGTIEGRSAAFRRDRLFVEEKLALGKVVLSMCRLSDQNNVYHIGVPAQDQTQDLNLARVDVNRHTASFYDLMSTQLHYNINATPAITDGGHIVHFQAPYYRVTGGRNNLQATPIDLPSAIHGADPLGRSNFLNWNGNLDILGLWNTPGVSTQIPPDGNVCAANPAYSHGLKNVERLGSEAVLRTRMGNHRFEQHYADFARTQLHMVDGGTAYFLTRMGRYTIMPTAMQGPNSILSQGHNYNNVVQTYGQNITGNVYSLDWNTNAPNVGGAARVGTLRPVLNDALTTFRTTALDGNRFEDTMNAYGNVSWFSAWEGHVSKTDRQPMNSVNRTSNPVVPQTSEFGFGATAHVLRHRDVVRAGWTGLDSYNNADHQQIVRMRLPTDIWATYHVMNGPPAFPISQAKFIKYWDCYRPMYDPELWWFSISA